MRDKKPAARFVVSGRNAGPDLPSRFVGRSSLKRHGPGSRAWYCRHVSRPTRAEPRHGVPTSDADVAFPEAGLTRQRAASTWASSV
eukprot:CAMPEP_0119476076 /NCGR_PEP_ID=MMETSP1344-20130328/6733_1 /TAXON_ID=236787 /ORGANISM="Florenciella parvula, Strain CCMP2471" /LENGTH=85 /DNA_ID=CAMNT_0007509759 /DNA_START=257 /DNA_END=515 /DNA_ORIENTATION=-